MPKAFFFFFNAGLEKKKKHIQHYFEKNNPLLLLRNPKCTKEKKKITKPQPTDEVSCSGPPSFRWLVFSDPGFQGMLSVLEAGEYPFPESWGFPSPFVGSLRPLKMVFMHCFCNSFLCGLY